MHGMRRVTRAWRLRRVCHALGPFMPCATVPRRVCSTTTTTKSTALVCSNALVVQPPVWCALARYVYTTDAPVSDTQLNEFMQWWQVHYRVAFHAVTSVTFDALLPSDLDDVLTFMQALTQGIQRICTTTQQEQVLQRQVVNEMRAVLMYMAQHRLYDALTRTLTDEKATVQSQHDTVVGGKESTRVEVTCDAVQKRSEDTTTTTSVVRRGPRERIRDNTLLVSATDIARAEQTVQLVNAICATAQPTRRVKAVLYKTVLYVMGMCDQLSAQALACASTCLARCWESYAFEHEILQQDECDSEDEAFVFDVGKVIQRHLRPCNATHKDEALSAEEVDERAEARRAGRSESALSAITPVSVIAHVQILTRAVCRRIEAVNIPDTTDVDVSANVKNLAVCDKEWQASQETLRRQRAASQAVLQLCSLQERKRREQQQQLQQSQLNAPSNKSGSVTPASPRGRRTVAQIAAARKQSMATQEKSNTVHAPITTNTTTTTTTSLMTLAAVAEVCTAVASMHYRESDFWSAIVRFTCHSIHHTAAEWCTTHKSDTGVNNEHMAEYMRHVRDVAFALDYVGQSVLYEKLITALLRAGLVQEPVPAPPSRRRHAMRHVTPSSSTIG